MSARPSVRNVDDWLVIATKNLAPVGKVRICAEIEAHFADGVEGHLAEGHSLEQARQAVLAELGDPWAAGKRFRKRHLTEKEAAFIQILSSRLYPIRLVALVTIGLGFPLFTVSFFASTLWFHQASLVRIILPATIAVVVAIAIALFITRHRKTAEGIRLTVAVELISNIFPIVLFPWAVSKPPLPWPVFFGVAALIISPESWRTFRLWLKIRGSCDPLSEAGPRAGLV
jgi:hypothetical protein